MIINNNPIEIEIIPFNEADRNIFVNIKEDNKLYHHIYFNNNKEEIKRNYFTNDDNVNRIRIIIDKEIKSLNGLFKKCNCIKKINFIKFNKKDINDMSYTFA